MSLQTDALKVEAYVPMPPMERIRAFGNIRGVYTICNVLDGKRYVGSSVNIKERLLTHYNDLSKNKHPNKHLQSAVNKYGLENFYPSVLDHYSEYPIHEVEMNFIEGLGTLNKEYGYNIAIPGMPPCLKGVPKTKEHNIKNSESKKGANNPNYGKPISDKVRQAIIDSNIKSRKVYTFINPEGLKVTFTGLAVFCRENGLSAACMSMVSQGKSNHHKGWSIHPKIDFKYNYKCKLSEAQRNSICGLYKNGEYNQKELAAMYGVVPSAIRKILIKTNSL